MVNSDLHKKLIATLIQAKHSNSEFQSLLHVLLTPSEINDISLRLEILRRLKANETQRSVSDSLGVGIATVSRGSRQLKQSGGILDKFL